MEDKRNLVNEFKGLENEEVFSRLAKRRNKLEIAIYNVQHDFNVGTIVRSANAFNVSKVYIIGRRKYNRRGAMCTDKYIEIIHCATVEEFFKTQAGREVVAIENNVERARPLGEKKFSEKTTLVFGSEGEGISAEILARCGDVRYIESFGSTRSVNVGVAAGIAMYEWVRQRVICQK